MANPVFIALLISILLLVLTWVWIPLGILIHKLLRKRKWWLIGLGAQGPDIREERIKTGEYLWKRRNGANGLVKFDETLLETDIEGRRVAFVDLATLQHIDPVTAKKRFPKVLAGMNMDLLETGTEPELDEEGKPTNGKTLVEFRQIEGYKGACINDDQESVIVNTKGEKKSFKWPVWRRVTGPRLLYWRLDERYEKMNETNPLLKILAIVLPLATLAMTVIVVVLLIVILQVVKGAAGAA